jgi:NCS1 family nucleobase:cation symporter-1
VDYYLLRKGRYDLEAFSRRDGVYGRWNAAGLIAYLVGCLAQLPFVATAAYHGPLARLVDDGDISWIVGTLVAGGIYYVLAPRLGNGMEIGRGDTGWGVSGRARSHP